MNISDEHLKRLVEAVERIAPPPLPQKGLHRHEITEKAISIRNTSKGKSLCQWTATEEPIPVAEVNAITGGFVALKWNVKPKTEKDGSVSYPEYLMVHVEASPTEIIVIRSNLQSNWSFQLLMALESLPIDALKDQFTILLLPNDMEKYDPAVFCRLYHKGVEVKYPYRKELKEDAAYLAKLVESFDAFLNPVAESSATEDNEPRVPKEHSYIDLGSTLPPVTKAQLQELAVRTQPPQSSLVNEQILAEYARLKLAANPDKGKELIQKHFGAEATHKSLTPDQKVEWLEILKGELPDPVFEALVEVVSEAVAEAIVGSEVLGSEPDPEITPEPVEVETGSIPQEDFRDLITKITVRETELRLTKLQIRGIIQANFGKVARNTLTDGEMLDYLEVLNKLEPRQ